jgi:hypothetical protein
MKSKTYNGEVRSSEKDFESLQSGAFATAGLLLAQGSVLLTAESGINLAAPRREPTPIPVDGATTFTNTTQELRIEYDLFRSA